MPTTSIKEIRQKYPQYEDMSDEQLAQALHRKYYSDMDFGEFSQRIGLSAEPPKERSLGQELGRQAGLAGRYAVEGLAGIPAMFAQPLADVADMGLSAAGSDFRFGNQAQGVSNLLTQAGAPQPENATERVVGDASRFLSGGGSVTGAAQKLPGKIAETLAARPLLQGVSEIAGGVGSGGAREAGLPGWAQTGVGLLAGLAIPGGAGAAPFVGRKAGEGIDTLKQLFGKRTDGMVDEFAGGTFPQEAQRRVRSAERLNQNITPAEALGDPILAARQGSLGTSDEGARSLVDFSNKRAAAQEASIDSLLDRLSSGSSAAADVRGTAQKIVKQQQDALSAQAKPLYEKAYEVTIPKQAQAALEADPVLAAAAKRIQRDPIYQKALDGAGPDRLKFWDLVKREVDDQAQSFKQSGERQKGGLVSDSTGTLKSILDDLSPDYAAARAIYGEGARPLQALREGAVGRIAALNDDKLKNVSRILFDPRETDPKVLNQLRQQFLKENPDAWKGIIRNEIERRLDATKGGKTGSNFYSTILAKDRDFRLFLNASRGMPDVQRTLMDMRRVWRDVINPESVKGAAGKAKSSLDVPRSSIEAGVNYVKNLLGGKADKAAVEFITDPKWADDLARIAKIKNQARREQELLKALDGVNRASGAAASAATLGGSQFSEPDGS